MMPNMNLHRIVEVRIVRKKTTDVFWTEFTFVDEDGDELGITAFGEGDWPKMVMPTED